MKKISKHISVAEMTCKCGCGICRPDPSIITMAEVARMTINVKHHYLHNHSEADWDYQEIKLHISSGCSCKEHNDKPQRKGGRGGSKKSQHIVKVERCSWCAGIGFALNPDGSKINCYVCDGVGKVYQNSHALDGWFYYGDDYNANRVDASDVLIRMYKDELIPGLVLYRASKCKACGGTGKRKGISEVIACGYCGGDGTIRDYRFHIDTRIDGRYFSDRR